MIVGWSDGSSRMHQSPTLTILSNYLLSTSLPLTSFPSSFTLKQWYANSSRIASSLGRFQSTFFLQHISSNNTIMKLYTSVLTVIGCFRSHSGATYPFVPQMPIKVLVWSSFSSFANPKLEIFAHPYSLLCHNEWFVTNTLHGDKEFILLCCVQFQFFHPNKVVFQVWRI